MNKFQICKNFNNLDLHDSKLIDFSLRRNEKTNGNTVDEFYFHILLLKVIQDVDSYEPWVLSFKECQFAKINIDLIGKKMCSDAMLDVFCSEKSELFEECTDKAVDDCLHFSIELIPPGGNIDIIAKDFTFKISEK